MEVIVHLYWEIRFGGIETMLVNIANSQSKLGYRVYVILINELCEKTLVDSFDTNINVINLNRCLHSKSPYFLFKLNAYLFKIKPNVIHIHDAYLYNILLPIFRHITCCTLHDVPFGSIKYVCHNNKIFYSLVELFHRIPGNVQSIDRIPQVFSISTVVHDKLLIKYGIKSFVVNNGIVVSNFMQKSECKKNGIFNIIQVSRLEHIKKGQDLLIEALCLLIKKGFEIKLSFIGEGQSMAYLKQLILDNGIEKNVEFLGKRPQTYIYKHLCDYDLFVQPSRYEGFGLTVAEAMAAKVPVLVSDGQGPSEITCSNKFGWTFENGNAKDLSDKIDFIIQHYEKAKFKASCGSEHIKNNYDIEVTSRKYIEKYNFFLKNLKK